MNTVPYLPESGKLQQAIATLELISRPKTFCVLKYLQRIPEAKFIDLLISTELDTEDLNSILTDLHRLNFVDRTGYDQSTYVLKRKRLFRIIPLIRAIAKDTWEESVFPPEEAFEEVIPMQV